MKKDELMMNYPLISVIIPAYKVEQYLDECITSVLSQTYTKIEVILIDDGSPDNVSNICDKYALADSRVKVLHKKNGGLSDSRNKGILKATGEYVMFLDADDFWDDKEALMKLMERINVTKPDVLCFSFKKYIEDLNKKLPYFRNNVEMPVSMITKQEQLEFISFQHLYISSACTKLIRRELLTEDFLFEVGVYSEDVEWSARLLKKAKSLDYIHLDFYCYRQRSNSISHTINDKKCQDLCHHIISCIKMSQQNGVEQNALSHYAAYQFGTYFIVQAQAEKKQKECIDMLSSYSEILKYHLNNKKLKALYYLTKIFGYRNLCFFIRLIYKIIK